MVQSYYNTVVSKCTRKDSAMGEENDLATVSLAFDRLLSEIDAAIASATEEGAEDFRRKDYERASQLLDKSRRMEAFRQTLVTMQAEWKAIAMAIPTVAAVPSEELRNSRAMIVPVLQIMLVAGGSEGPPAIWDKLPVSMKKRFNKQDLYNLGNIMAQERLISKTAHQNRKRRVVWLMTDKGREYLAKARNPAA